MDGMQHLYGPPTGLALGAVTDSVDPQSRGRVRVTLLADGMLVWAACVVPSAGSASGPNYGVALLPKIGEVVLVAFLTPDQAFVLGAVWSGQGAAPAGAAPVEDRYAIATKKGTVLLFDDTGPAFSITTPAGNSISLTDSGGGSCTIEVGGSTIQVTPSGVSINGSSTLSLQTSSMSVSAASVNVDAASQQHSGLVQCDTLVANTVAGTSYTPGAGNIW
jgi:uncharacterized protein involved in type VI secretion and phage assembly